MKNMKSVAFAITLIALLLLSACSPDIQQKDTPTLPSSNTGLSLPDVSEGNPAESISETLGQIYLYGERHGVESILNKELELWHDYYHNEGMRHLFVELPYYTAEFTNIWMQADSDEILDALFNDSAGTAADTPAGKEFYKKIKSEYPETIFHGTDVGHQHRYYRKTVFRIS